MTVPLIHVALGGAIGAALRYMTGIAILRLTGSGFPLAILTANIVGSILMGIFVAAAARYELAHLGPFVMVGLLGGFTTFSSFSLEAMTLMERGQLGQAALYVALSVGLSISGLFLGTLLARAVFA
ncbi:MAG: fluoride efflux transporter CrcB [Pseudomonadota bacterium]